MATSDNVLTKLHDLLLYIIPQLGKFPRDQKFLLADRIQVKLMDVQERCVRLSNNIGFRSAKGILRGALSTEAHQGGADGVHGPTWRPTGKPTGHGLFPASQVRGTNNKAVPGLVTVGPPAAKARAGNSQFSRLLPNSIMRLPRPFVQFLTAIISLATVPLTHATSGDSTPFLLDTRNYDDSTPLFSVDTRAPDLIANTGITDSGGNSFTVTMAMLKVTGSGTITFTLVTDPVHGTLFLDGLAQGAGATFTQAQIDAGLVSYQRAAGDPLTDTFELAAMDDNAGLLGGNFIFAVAGIPGASGTLFLVDTRNYTESAASTVHTDNHVYVTTDIVPGSLRQAVANAGTGETIDFDASLTGLPIVLGGTPLSIDKEVTINGAGMIISGNNASRVFDLHAGSDVTLDHLTITDGNSGAENGGGGIRNFGELELRDSMVAGNTGKRGGGILNESTGILVATGVTIANNKSTIDGGGIFNWRGKLTLSNSTLSGNTTPFFGGGIYALNGGTVTFNHATISDNTGSTGGGIFNRGTLSLESVLIAGNDAGTAPDIGTLGGTITTTGASLTGINSTVETMFPAGPLAGTAANPLDPLLAPLGDYGGPTQTVPLRAGSPAINAAGASALPTDQRGFTRVGIPDIGAYESGNAAGYGVWATEMINEGLDASFTGNADEDPSANGTEYALGTSVLISDPASPHNPEVITNGSGGIKITFGFNPIAAVDTRWIIERSTDLENFSEIYRYDGPTSTGTPVAGVSANVGGKSITITDTKPPTPNVFYRFGAKTTP